MYAALVAAAGYLPLALSAQDYLELLPVAWRRITAEGIRLGYLTYDAPALNPYRGQPSPITTRGGRWKVHYDPYDLPRVWLRPHQDQNWITVPWIHRGQVAAPFADFTLRHVRRLLTTHGQDQDPSRHRRGPARRRPRCRTRRPRHIHHPTLDPTARLDPTP